MDSIYGFTASNNETIYFYLSEEDSEDSDEIDENKTPRPNKGARSGFAPVLCTIDLTSNCLVGSEILSQVTEYQIWDEFGGYCLDISYDEKDFIMSLKELPATTYKLILRGNDFSLIGLYYR